MYIESSYSCPAYNFVVHQRMLKYQDNLSTSIAMLLASKSRVTVDTFFHIPNTDIVKVHVCVQPLYYDIQHWILK